MTAVEVGAIPAAVWCGGRVTGWLAGHTPHPSRPHLIVGCTSPTLSLALLLIRSVVVAAILLQRVSRSTRRVLLQKILEYYGSTHHKFLH